MLPPPNGRFSYDFQLKMGWHAPRDGQNRRRLDAALSGMARDRSVASEVIEPR
jgi:hypothetical protein